MRKLRNFLSEALTLQYHSELNPKFWSNYFLREEVREKLLEIAKEWLKFSKTPISSVEDIILTGGNANFNYTDKSDLDIHILLDPNKIPSCYNETDYYKDKKLIWSLTHDIEIYGSPVEVYAHTSDVQPPHKNQGIYSLKQAKWVMKPERANVNFEKDELFQRKLDDLIVEIEHAMQSTTDTKVAEKLLDKITKTRRASIAKGGEFSQENLIFKELRNLGYIDKIRSFVISKVDDRLSLR